MLDKAVIVVKADQSVALAMFLKGEGGFRDRDLYPFCFRSGDGKTLTSPPSVPAGTDIRTLRMQPAMYMVRDSMLRRRSPKVKSPKFELYVCKARRRRKAAVSEGELRNQGRRTRLRRRILQVAHPQVGVTYGAATHVALS